MTCLKKKQDSPNFYPNLQALLSSVVVPCGDLGIMVETNKTIDIECYDSSVILRCFPNASPVVSCICSSCCCSCLCFSRAGFAGQDELVVNSQFTRIRKIELALATGRDL